MEQFREGKGVDSGCLAMNQVETDDRQQHEERAANGKQEEPQCRLDPLPLSPDTDEEKQGDQHHFPEQVEKKQVEGQKYPQDSCGRKEQQAVVGGNPVGDGFPGKEHGKSGKE